MTYSVVATTNGRTTERRLIADSAKHPVVLSGALSRLAFFARKDSQESMKRELDRPKPFTLNAVQYQKSNRTTLKSAVFVNPNNEYLPRVVFGGVRRNSGRILVPNVKLRSDRYGNLTKTRRKRILNSPKTFKRTKGGKQYLLRRIGRRVEFVASLEQSTQYKQGGYWDFHGSQLKTYDRRFALLFNEQYIKVIGRR